MNALDKLRPMALLLLRAALGVIFIYHGFPKLFGDTALYTRSFVSYGLPGYLSYAAGMVELFGGTLLLLGLFTRVAGLLLTAGMVVALWKSHPGAGLLAINEYEFHLALLGAAFVLATTGAGPLSLDFAIFRKEA
jgi:putative oxidoreductase